MRFWFFVTAAFLATPAVAQDRMTQAGCDAGWALVSNVIGNDDKDSAQSYVADDGWCALDDVTMPLDPTNHLVLGSLRWRAMDMNRYLDEGLPPRSLELVLKDGRMTPQTGDAFLDWAMELRLARDTFSATVDVRWDEVQNAVLLQDLSVDLPGEDALSLKGRVDDVDLSSVAAMQTSLGSAGLRDLDVSITLNGLFENYVLLPLGYALFDPEGAAPGVQMQERITQARAFVAELPDSLLPSRSKDAADAFLDDMPTPSGTLRMQLQTETPIGMARLAPVAMTGTDSLQEAILTALDGAVLGLHWSATAGASQ